MVGVYEDVNFIYHGFIATVDLFNGTLVGVNLKKSTWFGYYTYTTYPFIYHYGLGYEYAYDAGNGGIYLFDYQSGHFFYTQASYWPFVYDFSLNAFLYYYTVNGVNGKRHFYEFGAHPGIISE